MKRVLLVVLLLYAKTVSAQSLSIGADFVGLTFYNFRQLPSYNDGPTNNNNAYDFSFEAFGQYTFKDSSFGIEASIMSEFNGIPQPPRFYYPPDAESTGFNSPTPFNLTTVGYFVYNPFPKQNEIKFQLKAGVFYSPFNDDYGNNYMDWGPAVGLYIAKRIYKQCYLGLDVSHMIGTQKYVFPSYVADNYSANGTYEGKYTVPTVLSQVSYTLFQLKLSCKL